jgi:hypothetical protein
MFKPNVKHLQPTLFSFQQQLPEKLTKELTESEEAKFYELVFRNIKEEDFACLYSETESRPNSAINCLVAALILMPRRHWSYEDLFRQMKFNLLTKVALGLQTMDEMPFCETTIFNFQTRLNEHYIATGENLLEKVFDYLTGKQLKELKLKTNIQRTDSFQANSNIRSYTRLQLLVEMVKRVYRVLSESDQKRFGELFAPYLAKTSGQYIYKLTADEFPRELEALGKVYHRIATELRPLYPDHDIFRVFDRVYAEHFTVAEETITVRPNTELTSGCLQSPDDIEATYREKRNKATRGQVVNVAETANPENPLNLISDVAVAANNVDDGQILGDRLDKMKQKTPDLDELHTDGAYPGTGNDIKCQELKITMVQTGIKGASPSGVELAITKENDSYSVSCPHQTVPAQKTRQRYKASFETSRCAQCPLAAECRYARQRYYFTEADYLRKRRQANIRLLPKERRTLRANVEATVRELKRGTDGGQLKVRGRFKTEVFAFTTAVSINFGRIFRYLGKVGDYIVKNGILCPATG